MLRSPLLLVRALCFVLLLAVPAAAEIPAAARAMLLLGRGDLEAARALLTTAPDTAQTELARGALAEAEGDFAAAAGHYREAAAELPAEAAYRLGNLAWRGGQAPSDVRRRYEHTLRLEPNHAMARYGLALVLQEEERYAEALEQVERVLALDPPAAYGLVRGLSRGRYDTLELAPVNLVRSQALILQGQLRERLGQEGASASWQAASDLAPAEILDPLLDLARTAEDPGEAALWLQAFLESSVEPTGVQADLAVWGPGAILVGGTKEVRSLRLGVDRDGRVFQVGGGSLGVRLPEGSHSMTVDRDGTVRVWQQDRQRAVGRLPLVGTDVEVLAGFRERHAGAELAWALARSLGPDTERLLRMLPFLPSGSQVGMLVPLTETPLAPLARARLGALYFGQFQSSRRMEDLHEARRQWTELRTLRPNLQFPVLNLATAALMDGQFDEAGTLLADLEKAHPDRSLPLRLEVQLAMARDQWDRASDAAARYRARFPHDPYPRFAQAEMLAAQDRKAEALAATDELIALNPALVEARYLRVRLLGRMGDVKRQKAELEALLELDPSPYRAQRLLGTLLDRTGETERALELYRRYLASPEALVYETEEWVGTEVRVREMTAP